MTKRTYLKMFKSELNAEAFMRRLNRAAKDRHDVYVITDGPEDNFAIMDLRSAIELGHGYRWEV